MKRIKIYFFSETYISEELTDVVDFEIKGECLVISIANRVGQVCYPVQNIKYFSTNV